MPKRAFFCVLPGERASLAEAVQSVGAIPVLDFTCSPTTSVPEGAWVRVRTRRSVPGVGPVILAGNHKAPVRNRETWLEVTEPGPLPAGFAGAVLRGAEVGGPCGALSGLEMLSRVARDQRVILDAGLSPSDAAVALASGAEGVVLSEVLLGLDEIGLPKQMMERLGRLDGGSFHVVNGFQIAASPLSPVLRRLLDGEGYWDLATNWFADGDLGRVAWPVGPGVRQAIDLAKEHRTITGLLGAYTVASETPQTAPVRRPTRSPAAADLAGEREEPVAIIGLGCRLPGALSVAAYWDNLVNGKSAIIDVPEERWDPELFWDEDKTAPDKTYAKIGGFLQGFTFDSRRFRIPPNVAKQVAVVQQITLESVGEALEDAGYGKDRQFDRTRVGVILGNSMGGEVTDDYVVRTRVPAFKEALKSLPEFAELDPDTQTAILDGFEAGVKGDLPIINEDSMPGELSNVIAGRVANAFDLCGPNFTVDAACASSMAAIQAAVKALQSNDIDMCVTGGADRSMGVPTYTKFCKIGALSPNHSAPFDRDANGFVMGEGAGVLVLKRLRDAHRDGDRVYAVIKGIGASSDGKGKGITAPNPRGQRLALERAYAAAGIDPVDVDLIECHGTSTVVGDKVEVESISAVIGAGRRGDRGPIRIGSVKSNIGHLKSAAGAASCIKAALALHNKTFPPTINFNNARSDVPFDAVPLAVQTSTEAWPDGPTRRVGVSAFGFGGTNFHVVLEEDRGPATAAASPGRSPLPALEDRPLPAWVWGVSATDRPGLIRALESSTSAPFDPSAPIRLAAAAPDSASRRDQVERALKVLRKNGSTELLRGRGIHVEESPYDGKVAFLFTGQGSQYIDMGLDLAEMYPVVAATFDEADEVMTPELGRPLRDFIRRNPEIPEEEQFERLRDTEISQPATLTVDVAILRLLAAHGILPDMVAGHSLGEYAAAVAAGILSFRDALVAVSARGREMAGVQIDDKGRMAGIAASVDKVQEVLAEIPGYVVPANKNCATQTVIAGASEPVEAAIEAFVSRGITVYPLPVSHAFHSSIVAPASAPLKTVLERLDIRPPQRPITTNVTSRYYPDGADARAEIIDILAKQVAAPVEWIAQVERMYADGARIFIECGPKRALTGFVASILKRRPHRAIYTNHPKRGGVASFQDALASLTTLGFDVSAHPGAAIPDIFAPPPPRLATSAAMRKWTPAPVDEGRPTQPQATPFILRAVLDVVAMATGYSPEELNLDDELEADLGIDTVKQAEVIAHVRDRFRLDHDPGFRLSQHRTLRDLANYAARRLGSTQPAAIEQVLVDTRGRVAVGSERPTVGGELPHDALSALAEGAARAGLSDGDANQFAASILPAVRGLVQTMLEARPAPLTPPAPVPAPLEPSAPAPVPAAPRSAPAVVPASISVVCSGASVGLPGGEEVFAPDNVARILDGEVRISRLSEATQDGFLAKQVVRVHKDPKTGQGTFKSVEQREEVIRLAGVKAAFDLAEQYGIDPQWVRALDITTQLSFAAGIEALKDAQIPLVQTFHTTRSGKKVSTGWKLPEEMRRSTGVIFASAFPGYDEFAKHMRADGRDDEGNFDRRFLFQVLAMGHSQFAQYIGAQGPNATTNAACASTTQAVAMASDWIRVGRCERVIVVGADDVTSDALMEWIGTGFLATGAATTKDVVEDAALPFDARRHGMILGMGAAGLVVESEASTSARGIVPLGRLLAARFANSAFHGTRLNPEHIATEMDALVAEAVERAGVSRDEFAASAVFMSHETYTPAKGGSAAAEIESLRRAFGAAASNVVVTNTKGFTGHPMGAGIEDTVVLKALQYGRVPPIPHLKQPDPDLGDLRLSRGGAVPVRYGIRLAAGFGSQLALLAWEGLAHAEHRIADAATHREWLKRVSGLAEPTLAEHQRHLRVTEAAAADAGIEPAVVEPPEAAPQLGSAGDVLSELLAVISEKTGYGPDELEPDYELEADLGIDTVKQAEIFGQVREQYGLAADESFRLADHPTIEALAGWLQAQVDAKGAVVAPSSDPVESMSTAAPVAPASTPQAPAVSGDVDALADLLAVIAEKTGYAVDELELDYELEADLGIDTVKQAEIFGQVREQYGLAADESFRLADYPTIEALAGWLQAQAASQNTASKADPVVEPASPPNADAAPPATPAATAQSERGALPASFRLRRPIGVARPPWQMGTIKGRIVTVLGTTPLADAIRTAVVAKGGRLDGPPDAIIDAGTDVFESFEQAQSVAEARPRDWVCAAHVGRVAVDPVTGRDFGSTAGFAKAVGREWDGTAARVVNVDRSMDVETAAALVIEELGTNDGSIEIAWGSDGRTAVELQLMDFPEQGAALTASVVALTGGTRGITAQVAKAFAGRGVSKLALLARTAPGTEPLDEAAAKASAKASLEESGMRATPAAVRDIVAPLKRAEEARRNVEAMRAMGAEVEFFQVDLADPEAVRSCLDRVRTSFGPIDVLVHGAGVEESRLIEDKDAGGFHRVYDGKAVGGLALAEALEPEAFFVSMGSVAGRFGNPGQVDYSAANEAMAQVCFARPASLHVDWTAWADVGMAVRGGMDKLLGDRGVEMLPAGPGSELLVDMVAAKLVGEVVVSGRLGDFGIAPAHPLIDGVEMDGESIIGTRSLSLVSDPWIADHAIDGKPVLPGVVGLEMMAAVAAMADPGHRYAGARNVVYEAPIKLHGDAPTTVVVTATPADGGVQCTVSSSRTARTGRVIETKHFSATVVWVPTDAADLPPMGMPDHPVSGDEIYARFFHGPAFQVLNRVTGVTSDGLLAEGAVRHLGIAGGMATAPLVLEAAFQAAGLHGMMLDGIMALPRAIGSVDVCGSVRDDEALHLTVRAQGSAYDVDVSTERGRVLRLRGFEMVQAGPLPPDGGFEPPAGGWSPAVIARVKAEDAEADASALLTDRERAVIAERGTEKRQSDRTLGRVAAKRALVQLTGMDPQTFRIENRASGEPYAVTLEGVELPHVSISHRDGEAIAIATSAGRAGVDLERIEARAPSFSETWFRVSERAMCQGDPRRESQVWAIKEAVLKALGTGLQLDPRDVEVLNIADGRAEVRLYGQASQRHAALGGGELSVDIQDDQSMVIAVAWLAS
ncbi:MAG: SDR family NAD(P)-dependent oxidoreductase [Myxococcota bacterium]|nr:SDR family NAD(P)-dependent oxidoreductase [Myxococcota bacterium]